MKNKYYTPSIEEFCVGFEYEVLLNSGKWEKHVFNPNKGNFSHRFMEETWFTDEKRSRAKYLDIEDIESFGFTRYKNTNSFNKGDFSVYLHENGEVDIENKKVTEDLGYSYQIFQDGKIKNKSEFKKILVQLGIE